jgi:hypothetical protein
MTGVKPKIMGELEIKETKNRIIATYSPNPTSIYNQFGNIRTDFHAVLAGAKDPES